MKKTCSFCGYIGEPIYKNGKEYCEICNGEIKIQLSKGNDSSNTYVCPICKNESGNTFNNGKCRCSLCGTEFSPQYVNSVAEDKQKNAKPKNDVLRKNIEENKNKNLVLGCVFLFFFWPVSIYFFYKYSQLSKELDDLDK